MLKKTIKYTDYDGNERTEEFYFNLNKAELTEMELSAKGGFKKLLEQIVKEEDGKKIADMFKDVILRSYGEKSADGKRFIKTQELRDAFSQTEAYVELYMEIISSAEAATLFVNGIIPQNLN